MSVFRATLRSRVERVQEAIVDARQAGHDYEAELHGARLADLLDLAARNGVDTTDWVDPAVMEAVVEPLLHRN
jgi:hypothetical protein